MPGWLPRPAFGTVVRLTAAGTLLAVALAVYGPRLVEERTREAVVNARLEPVRAPIPGVLAADIGAPGRAVNPGEVIAVVEDPRVERARESRFAVDLAEARGRLRAVRAELARLGALDAGLEARRLRAVETRLLDAALARRQVEARLSGARAAVAERRAHLDRVRRLRAVRAVPQEELEQAERTLAEAQARVRELELERERAMVRLRTLATGMLAAGAEDVPYSRRRMDEIALRLGDLVRERERLEAEVRALGEALARERARREAEARVAVRAPFPAVVWRRDVSAGAAVPRDQVLGLLLDCRKLYVTAIVHQRGFDALVPGLPARARPFGESRWLPGRVVAVRAAPLTGEDGFAVLLRPLEEDEAVVLVELDAPQLAGDPARFCHVGRTVELALDRGIPVVSRLYRVVADLFRATGEAPPARAQGETRGPAEDHGQGERGALPAGGSAATRHPRTSSRHMRRAGTGRPCRGGRTGGRHAGGTRPVALRRGSASRGAGTTGCDAPRPPAPAPRTTATPAPRCCAGGSGTAWRRDAAQAPRGHGRIVPKDRGTASVEVGRMGQPAAIGWWPAVLRGAPEPARSATAWRARP